MLSIKVRLIFTVITLPITLFIIFISLHGLVLGYEGVKSGDALLMFMGLLTVTGIIGVVGAWLEVLYVSPKSIKLTYVIRRMLGLGILTGFMLCSWMFYSANWGLYPLAPLFLSGIGIQLLKHSSPNKSLKQDK